MYFLIIWQFLAIKLVFCVFFYNLFVIVIQICYDWTYSYKLTFAALEGAMVLATVGPVVWNVWSLSL